jgi:hypothetical protein
VAGTVEEVAGTVEEVAGIGDEVSGTGVGAYAVPGVDTRGS